LVVLCIIGIGLYTTGRFTTVTGSYIMITERLNERKNRAMNTMLMTTNKCRKEQQEKKRAYEQRALGVPLRNSRKLRWYFMCI
jgi:hypothetical protein